MQRTQRSSTIYIICIGDSLLSCPMLWCASTRHMVCRCVAIVEPIWNVHRASCAVNGLRSGNAIKQSFRTFAVKWNVSVCVRMTHLSHSEFRVNTTSPTTNKLTIRSSGKQKLFDFIVLFPLSKTPKQPQSQQTKREETQRIHVVSCDSIFSISFEVPAWRMQSTQNGILC